jgi:hypothetical protein
MYISFLRLLIYKLYDIENIYFGFYASVGVPANSLISIVGQPDIRAMDI